MADRFPGDITIGSNIPLRLLDLLSEVIAEEVVSIGWQYRLDKASIRQAIENAAARKETVQFTDDQAAYGQFDELEGFLIKHRIHFNRHSDARYEYDAENVYYRGRGRPVTMLSTQDSNDVVYCHGVLDILQCKSMNVQKKLEKLRKLVAPLEATIPLSPIRLIQGGRK